MIKKKFVRKFLPVLLLVITFLLLYSTFSENYDTEYHATFDYECKANGSEPDPEVTHYCIHGPKIFFVETSEAGKLTARQACAVESTARHNPSMTVSVLMTPSSSIDFSDDLVKILTSLSNVALQQINVDVFVHGTPVWEWLRTGRWKLSEWKFYPLPGMTLHPKTIVGTVDLASEFMIKCKVSHLSDALRFLVVWKYGGIYLDLDIVTLRSLELLENSVITENWERVAAGMLFFHSNHELMRLCMEDFAKNYDPYNFVRNGPGLMTRNLKEFCNVQDVGKVSGSECGVDVLPPETAFPIPWDHWEEYLKPVQLNITISSRFPSSYMIHVWNKYSREGKLVIGTNSLYERAMKEHCPLVYQHALKFKEI